jgi:hypothetical protein
LLDKPYLLTMKHIRDLHKKFLDHPTIKKFHVSNIELIPSELSNAILGSNTKTRISKSKKKGNMKYEVYD